jgi:endoglucanase
MSSNTPDDARQAPVNYTHFDGYSMGASSDSPFAAGEHIPAASKTDGRIYSPRLGPLDTDGNYSGVPDDRWAFTSHTTPLNYAAAASLAAASRVLRGFDYVLGRHPVSNVSYVSTVGTSSKLVAYGNNRADYTFIPGGMIPGVVIIQPDFPELKDQWPFLWYENEYVVDAASTFILAANAAQALTH